MPPTPPASSDVRAWAQAKGLPVGDRGRIRSEVVAAYLADTASGAGARRVAKSERTRGKASTASAAPAVPGSGPKARVSGAAVARATAPEPAPAVEEAPAAPEAVVVAALQDRVDGLERQVTELRDALQAATDRLDALTQASIRRRPSLRRRLSG